MTISVVQTQVSSGGSPTFGANVTAGNTVFYCVQAFAGTAAMSSTSVTLGGSSVTGATKLLELNSPVNSGHAVYFAIWMLPNCPGGHANLAEVMTGASGILGTQAIEVAGLGTTPAIDKSSSGSNATSSAVDSGATSAITSAPEFIVGCAAVFQHSSAGPSTGGWTDLEGTDQGWGGYQIAVSSGGTYEWTQTANSTGNPWASGVATIGIPAPPTTSTGSVALAPMATSGSGMVPVFGTGGVALAPMGTNGGSRTPPPPIPSATSTPGGAVPGFIQPSNPLNGPPQNVFAGTITMAPLSLSGTTVGGISASGSLALAPMHESGVIAEAEPETGSVALAPMTLSGSATVVSSGSAGGSVALAPMSLSATASVSGVTTGSSALAPMALSGHGQVVADITTEGSLSLATMRMIAGNIHPVPSAAFGTFTSFQYSGTLTTASED